MNIIFKFHQCYVGTHFSNDVATKLFFYSYFYKPLIINAESLCKVGFTLSQATKALRESRGIVLLYFRPLH